MGNYKLSERAVSLYILEDKLKMIHLKVQDLSQMHKREAESIFRARNRSHVHGISGSHWISHE